MNRNFLLAMSIIIALTFGCSQDSSTSRRELSDAIKTQEQAQLELKKAMVKQIRELVVLRDALTAMEKNDGLENIKTGINETIYEKFALQDQKLESLKDSISEDLYNKSKESLNEFQAAVQEKIDVCNQAIAALNSPEPVSEETQEQIRESLQDNDKIVESLQKVEEVKEEIKKELEENGEVDKAKEFDDDFIVLSIMQILKAAIMACCAYFCPGALPYVAAQLCVLSVAECSMMNNQSTDKSGDDANSSANNGAKLNLGNGTGKDLEKVLIDALVTNLGNGSGTDYGNLIKKALEKGAGIITGNAPGKGNGPGSGNGPRRAGPVGEGEYDCSINIDKDGKFHGFDLKQKSGNDLAVVEKITFEDSKGWLMAARNRAKTYEIERDGNTVRLIYVNDEENWRRPFTFIKENSDNPDGKWILQP